MISLYYYQDEAVKTSLGTKIDKDFVYTIFGMSGEVGELHDALRYIDKVNVKKEMGDVCWYIAMTAYYLNMSWEYIADMALNGEYAPFMDGITLTSELFYQVSSIAEITKKLYRDKNGEVDFEYINSVEKRLINMLRAMNEFCLYSVDFSLSDVLQLNVEKLQLRKSTGTINGNGDNRETESKQSPIS